MSVFSPDVEQLKRAASAGDSAAQYALGRRLLTLPPFDLSEGLKWAQRAANQGSAEASRFLAVLTAAGIGAKHNLDSALDHMQRAVEGGDRPAQAELSLLAGEAQLASGIADARATASQPWSALRNSGDVARWLDLPKPRVISTSPRIALMEGFISPAICDWLIALGRPRLKRAQTYDPATGDLRYESARSNSTAQIMLADLDLVLAFVRARIAALTGLRLDGFEDSMILHYATGEQFLPHYDFLDVSFPGYANDVARHGQRVVTLLIYLNDDYDGGETAFPTLGRSFKGAKGDALFFWNVTPDGAGDKRSFHAGTPPTRGEKWLFSQWIRYRAP